MSFRDFTPEQRKAMAAKSAETRRAKRQAQLEDAETIPEIEELTQPVEIIYGEIEETEPALAPQPEDASPFGLFLASLDAETREMLDNDELRVIYDAQVAKAYAEKKAAKKKMAGELAANAARMEAGLIPMATIQDMETAKRNAELVRFTVELPPAGDNGEVADIGLRIDQRVFLHGHTYTLPRAQADTFREMIYRAREMELTFKGQSRRMRQYMQGSMDSNRWHVNLNPDGSLA